MNSVWNDPGLTRSVPAPSGGLGKRSPTVYSLSNSVPGPFRPQCFTIRARSSLLARASLDFAAGTDRPSRPSHVPHRQLLIVVKQHDIPKGWRHSQYLFSHELQDFLPAKFVLWIRSLANQLKSKIGFGRLSR